MKEDLDILKQSFKGCPNCKRNIFRTVTKCPICGYEFISTDCSAEIIEKQAVSLFEMAGWVVTASEKRHDLELSFNGKSAGFVEIFKDISESNVAKKITLFKKSLLQEKPKIAVLTNLYTFFVSYNGKPFIEIRHAPTPYEREYLEDFLKEQLELMCVEMGDKNDGDK